MNTKVKAAGLLCVGLLWAATGPLYGQFVQVNAGAVDTNLNSKLKFLNGPAFDVSSGYVHPLYYTVVTNFVMTNEFYTSTNLAFWSESNTNSTGSPAAPGSFLVCEVMSVTGPAGGVLTFWEQGWRVPTLYFPVGISPVAGSNRFDVSDSGLGAGRAYADPIGRIPLRRFTVNKAGDYLLTFKLYEASTNSPSWGPLHAPSDPITIKFSTGVDLAMTRIRLTNNVATLTFKQGGMTNLLVEASATMAPGSWVPVAGPFPNAPAGTNTTTRAITNGPDAKLFYRLTGPLPLP